MSWSIAHGAEVGHWVAPRVAGQYHAEMSEAIGLVREGKIVAGVIYENWNGASIVTHIAIEGRLSPGYLFAIYHYPFVQCGVRKIIAPVSAGNTKSVAMCLNMGFIIEARIADATPDGDLLMLTMTADKCRFLGDRYGKKCKGTARP